MPVLFDDPAAAHDLYRARLAPFLAAWGHLVPERAKAVGEWFALHGARSRTGDHLFLAARKAGASVAIMLVAAR